MSNVDSIITGNESPEEKPAKEKSLDMESRRLQNTTEEKPIRDRSSDTENRRLQKTTEEKSSKEKALDTENRRIQKTTEEKCAKDKSSDIENKKPQKTTEEKLSKGKSSDTESKRIGLQKTTEEKSSKDKCSDTESIASRTGKVEIALIETILDEMKSEFNREINIKENMKSEKADDNKDSSNEVAETQEEALKSEGEKNNSDVKSDELEKEKDTEEICDKEVVEKPDEKSETSCKDIKFDEAVNKEQEDCKPRILLTLKTQEESGEVSKKSKGKTPQDDDDTVSSTKTEPEETGHSTSITSGGTASGKRSLRSQAAAVKAQTEEPAGVKRSARRRSKDSPRESVLQSAIARKEKSFSSLSQSDDKNAAARHLKASHRSPHLSPVERNQSARSSKSPARAPAQVPKSPRLAQLVAEQSNAKSNKAEESTGASMDASVKSSSSVKNSIPPVRHKSGLRTVVKASVQGSSAPAYTKTGKRRYRPYKGLRYSFTGGNVRRTKPTRRPMKEIRSSNSPSETTKPSEPEESNEAVVPSEEQPPAVVPMKTEELECADPIAKSHAAEFPSVELGGSRSGSPVIAEACQTASQKRKQPDDEEEEDMKEDGTKRSRHSNVPSPSPADSSQGPAKPESTAISSGAGTAALCCCQIKSQLFVSSKGQNGAAPADLYCQAMDTLDDRLVGCCNPVTTQDTCLSRPSRRVPFLILCDVHMQRLLRHNCCPGCGIFCTQGKFVQCASAHWYHRDCQLIVDSASMCPHCGLDSPLNDVLLSLRSAKNPVFLPQQKPPKKVPSAKMSFCGSRTAGVKTEEVTLREPTPPLVPPELLNVPVSSATLDKDKLAKLLSVACSMRKPTTPLPRYSLKSLYQAAKSGNAEKLVHILGSGLNPNHPFRECSMGTALHVASAAGHLPVVHILIQAGANMDVLDRDQNTPLMLAAVGNHNAVVKYLVKAGANVTLKGCDGMTALHLAAKAGNLESCHYLLTVTNVARSFINSVDDGGWTPLVWAAEHCHIDVARYLLQNRADPLIRDAEQNIALHWSAFSGSVDISEMLLNHGCEVNCTNVHGDTPLHIGARQNNYNCVLLLLARGARVDVTNKAGDNPLDCCFSSNSECYIAINLNVQLKAIVANPRERTQRILTNDISRGQEQNPIQCVNVEDDEGEPMDFVYVSENCFTSQINVDRTITSLQSCKCVDVCSTVSCHCGNISLRCWYDDQGRLLPDFNYADPPMLFECNQACTCNRVTCHNRVVQHGLTARFQLFRTKDKGWGVRTLRSISKGTYVCEYIGEIISDCEADHREDDSYLFDLDNRDGETYCIDARHYGNIARFINHMCVPNLLPVRVFIEHQDLHFPRIAFFANRDIEADEELGFDYGEKFWIIKCKSFTCTCGAETCRYSETTIRQTLDNYNKRLLQDEILLQQSELRMLQ